MQKVSWKFPIKYIKYQKLELITETFCPNFYYSKTKDNDKVSRSILTWRNFPMTWIRPILIKGTEHIIRFFKRRWLSKDYVEIMSNYLGELTQSSKKKVESLSGTADRFAEAGAWSRHRGSGDQTSGAGPQSSSGRPPPIIICQQSHHEQWRLVSSDISEQWRLAKNVSPS